jgi:hypothetical protein
MEMMVKGQYRRFVVWLFVQDGDGYDTP